MRETEKRKGEHLHDVNKSFSEKESKDFDAQPVTRMRNIGL